MLTYKASFKEVEGIIIGEVLDFPGTVSYGKTLPECRKNLAEAPVDMAETNLMRNETLPLPNPELSNADADLEEVMLYSMKRA